MFLLPLIILTLPLLYLFKRKMVIYNSYPHINDNDFVYIFNDDDDDFYYLGENFE